MLPFERHSTRGQVSPFFAWQIEDNDGTSWVIDYRAKSLFRAFADLRVVAVGSQYEPPHGTAHLIGKPGGKKLRHSRVSTMRLVEVPPDSELVGVGNADFLWGRFERGATDSGEAVLSFVIEAGGSFVVANDPAGVTLGAVVGVWAYLNVQPPPLISVPPYKYLWIICPCSEAVVWDFCMRSGIGPFARGRLFEKPETIIQEPCKKGGN